ncbi:hypothetical protein Gotur_007891 [Gossypium turneri]
MEVQYLHKNTRIKASPLRMRASDVGEQLGLNSGLVKLELVDSLVRNKMVSNGRLFGVVKAKRKLRKALHEILIVRLKSKMTKEALTFRKAKLARMKDNRLVFVLHFGCLLVVVMLECSAQIWRNERMDRLKGDLRKFGSIVGTWQAMARSNCEQVSFMAN